MRFEISVLCHCVILCCNFFALRCLQVAVLSWVCICKLHSIKPPAQLVEQVRYIMKNHLECMLHKVENGLDECSAYLIGYLF